MNEDQIILEIVQLKSDVAELQNDMTETKSMVQEILTGQDKMIGILQHVDQERIMTNVHLERHDQRIATLEKQAV